jgi:hypothetical protein
VRLPEDIEYVQIDAGLDQEYPIYSANLSDVEAPWRHDSTKLASSILDLYNERTGPIGHEMNSGL